MSIITVFVKGESLAFTLQEIVQYTVSNTEYINYLAFHSRVTVSGKQTKLKKKKKPPMSARALGEEHYFYMIYIHLHNKISSL